MPATERLERPPITLASWDTTFKMLKLIAGHNRRRVSLVEAHQVLLHDFYDAWFDIAAGKGGEKLHTLIDRYEEKDSLAYNPRLIHQLNPYFAIIRARFPGAELGD